MYAKFSLSWSQDITDITSQAKRLLTISNEAGLEVTVDFDKLVRHCQIRHAWARTVHTFQVRTHAHTATRVPACVSKFLSSAWQSAWQKTLKEEFLAAYSLRVWALVAGKTAGACGGWWRCIHSEEAEDKIAAQSVSFSSSLGSQPIEWFPPCLEWVFPLQWTQSETPS